MKYYLSNLIPRLKKFSVSLDQSAFLVDKPWVVSNNSGPFEKLIFRRDGRVHLSSNGKVQDGKWEYLPEAQSLLIDYGDMKKLYNHQYLDEAVLALKQDGSKLEDDYFLLANENAVPDCDAKKYLKDKYLAEKAKHLAKNNIEIKLLDNGKEIELVDQEGSFHKKALFNGSPVKDGSYFLKGKREKIVIEDGNIINTKSKINYSDGISIWQNPHYPSNGDLVEGIDNSKVSIYRESTKYSIVVENGRIKKIIDHTDRNIIIITLLFITFCVILGLILGS